MLIVTTAAEYVLVWFEDGETLSVEQLFKRMGRSPHRASRIHTAFGVLNTKGVLRRTPLPNPPQRSHYPPFQFTRIS